MPQAKTSTHPGLTIHLDQPLSHPYFPGSAISGHVNLSPQTDLHVSNIAITFYGRSKVKIHQSHGEHQSFYRSRANFFRISTELFTSTQGFRAGVGGRWEWPFSIICPQHIDGEVLRDTGKVLKGTKFRKSKKGTFLDFEEHGATSTESIGGEPRNTKDMAMHTSLAVPTHAMPDAMKYYHGVFGRQAFGYVEYVLEATLMETASGQKNMLGMEKGSKKRVTTTIINFIPGRKEPVLREGDMDMVEEIRNISTKPGARKSTLTAPELSLSTTATGSSYDDNPVKRPSSSPALFSRLSFNTASSTAPPALTVTITHPKTIQVAHPHPIPFKLSIHPSTTLTDQPTTIPTLTLTTFILHLICTTTVRAPSTLTDHSDTKTVIIKLADNIPLNHPISLTPLSLTNYNSPPHYSPPHTNTNTSYNTFHNEISSFHINLSHLKPLHLHASQQLSKKIHEKILIPSFKTYNIAREYGLRWCMEFEVEDPPAFSSSSFVVTKRSSMGGKGRKIQLKGEVPRGGIRVVGIADCVRQKLGMEVGWGGNGAGGDGEGEGEWENEDEDEDEGEGDGWRMDAKF